MNGKKRDGDILSSFQKKCKKNYEEPSTLNMELNGDNALQVDTEVNQEGKISDDKSETQVQELNADNTLQVNTEVNQEENMSDNKSESQVQGLNADNTLQVDTEVNQERKISDDKSESQVQQLNADNALQVDTEVNQEGKIADDKSESQVQELNADNTLQVDTEVNQEGKISYEKSESQVQELNADNTLQVDTEVNQEGNISGDKSKTQVQAEYRVVQKFPERIAYLNELLKKPEFCISEIDLKCSLELPTVFKLGNNVNNCDGKNRGKSPDSNSFYTTPEQLIPCNKNIIESFKILKPNIQQLIEDTNALKLWVSLLIPKIEDGNNFGVSVQEGTLVQILQVEMEATTYLKLAASYYAHRGKLVTKVMKYPYVEDYKLSIDELDKKTYVAIAITMHEIHNHYTTLHDIVIKNFDKLKKPRSLNSDSFY